ncbi:WAT1-related protein At1g25270 isoform X2 [Ricinus communis]|uniref:WAT1-related protein At1g25270 isoform X2 n=1 Tax=Ricinus communis TaxID=3988 RepID=UPI00201ADC1E|nr:WAT1-related protein At1g25270 isoform X2 [Ricinus communis]
MKFYTALMQFQKHCLLFHYIQQAIYIYIYRCLSYYMYISTSTLSFFFFSLLILANSSKFECRAVRILENRDMRNICEVLHGLKPVMLMVLAQFIYAGMNIFYKVAANDGMSMRVLVAYRWIFSTAFTVPLALIIERKKRPKLTWKILGQAFLNGLFGATLSQNLYVESLIMTSATFAAAISNLGPAITLILAASFGLEKLRLRTSVGKAKLLGILLGIGGAMVFTFYRGAEIKIWSTNFHLLNHTSHQPQHSHITSDRILGSCMALGSCVSFALWLIFQTKMSKIYPCHYSNAALMSIMGSTQCVIVALCMERNWTQWKLGWNVRLLTVFYSGIVTSGLVVTLIAWCVCMRGPVFVASFNPLSLVLVAIAGSLMLDEKLHQGSIVGAGLIVCGLYMVLWGQSKEMKEKAKLGLTESSPGIGLVEVATDGDQTSNISPPDEEGSLPKEQHPQNY